MAFKSSPIPSAVLMLLLISWREGAHCVGLTVDPPEDITICDPGHLGYLEITWSPSNSLINRTDCTTMYQLEYFNTYKGRWNLLRTSRRTYSAQFDMMKDIRVRVYTLLSGSCTNNSLIRSNNYTELIQKPQNTGVMGTEVRNFTCVYHNMEDVVCKWTNNPKMPANSKRHLYFWYNDLEKAEECPQYTISDGVRSGCNFTGKSLPQFTDINFCVNGSSQEGPLKQTFTLLQIQNQVKPAAAKKPRVQISSDTQLEVQWESPDSRVPVDCLEWEVELNINGKTLIYTSHTTSLTLPHTDNNERSCVRVRSKMHKYCADTGFWSDWSHPWCKAMELMPPLSHPDKRLKDHLNMLNKVKSEAKLLSEKLEDVPEAGLDVVPVYIYIAIAILAMMVLTLCMGAVLRLKKPRQEEKLGSLLTALVSRHTSVTATEV